MLSTALRVADVIASNWKHHAADHDPDSGENTAHALQSSEKKQKSPLKLQML